MKALISNDDGINASGIFAAKKAVENLKIFLRRNKRTSRGAETFVIDIVKNI